MRIIIAPASPRTGRATIEALLRHPDEPKIVGVYRDTNKVPAEIASHPRFEAVQGDVADVDSLDFSDADAVVTISPPQYSSNDPIAIAKANAENVRGAVAKSGSVKRVVYVSSVGAELEHETGEIQTNHVAEVALRDAAPEVVFVRCAYFMHNYNLPTLQEEKPFFHSVITPADLEVPMVAVKDIGTTTAAQAIAAGTSLPQNPFAFELHGPKAYSTNEVQQALAAVLGKDVRAELVPKEGLGDFFSTFLPPNVARLFVQMTTAFLPGGVMDGSKPRTGKVEKGSVNLVEGFREMLSS